MIELMPIGVVCSPFKGLSGIPIEPAGAARVKGTVKIFEEYHAGLKDLDRFPPIIWLYYFHGGHRFNLRLAIRSSRST